MNNITVRITTDSSGKPSKTTIAQGTLGATQVTTSFNYLSVPFTSSPALGPGTVYWIVLDTTNTWGEYYTLGAAAGSYANGVAKIGTWSASSGGTWNDTTPLGLDGYFTLYAGGDTGLISGTIVGQSGSGDACAHEVNNSTVAGTIFCQASFNNNKPCDTSRPDPVQAPFPISDGNIADWRAEAEAGGVFTGDKSYEGGSTASLGPLKVQGNLSVGGGSTLNITGTLSVTGSVSVSGGGVIQLSPAYGGASGILLTDGRISASGEGRFQGSGIAGSYILAVTTSVCPDGCGGNPAIGISGGAGSVVLYAGSGTITFSGGAQAKQATAKKITMTGGATITYESGLQDLRFESGPSGSWKSAHGTRSEAPWLLVLKT